MVKEKLFEDLEEEKIDEDEEIKGVNKKKRHPAVAALWGIFDFIKTVAMIVVIAFAIRIFALQPYIVEGQSMEPTFQNNDYIITEKVTYRLKEPARGDIVIFHPPDNPSINYIKRIIGLPGDQIEVKGEAVYVNGTKLNESYLASATQGSNLNQPLAKTTVSADEYYVMGDNRDHSRDSREIGAIPKQNVVSHIWFRLLPLNSIEAFAKFNYSPSP
jgi:signal peptidase I